MTLSPDQIIAQQAFAKFKDDNYPSLSDDHAFERFAVNLELKHHGIENADLESGLVASSNDGGIDGFYILLNQTELVTADSVRISRSVKALRGLQQSVEVDVYIIQAKRNLSGTRTYSRK